MFTMKGFTFLLLVFFCYGCSNKPKKTNKSTKEGAIVKAAERDNKSERMSSAAKSKLIGAWTDGKSENATFDITPDSVYYTEQFKSYKYVIDQDSIKIYYPDFEYRAKFYFTKDTLVMDSRDYGISKFWKFKN